LYRASRPSTASSNFTGDPFSREFIRILLSSESSVTRTLSAGRSSLTYPAGARCAGNGGSFPAASISSVPLSTVCFLTGFKIMVFMPMALKSPLLKRTVSEVTRAMAGFGLMAASAIRRQQNW